VLDESNPGVLPLEQCVLGGDGLLPAKLGAAERPYATLAEVERAKAEGAQNYVIGGAAHAMSALLVEAELSGRWAPFERLLRSAPEGAHATGGKMETEPKFFVYGSTGEYMRGLTVEGGLTRSMEQEFAENDEGRWKAEYDYVVEREAIEVPEAPSDDSALLLATARLEAIGLKGIKRRDQGHERMRLADFCALPSAVDAQLTAAEVAALRLYTGPPYKPMNEALRAKEIRKWATTISLVCSAVLKLSMLSKPACAYRGVKEDDLQIPASFLDGDFAGGVELGFSSTTTKPDVALKYSGKAKGSIFELEFTMTSRGASIQFLSQCAADAKQYRTHAASTPTRPHARCASARCRRFPHEEELLFPPRTAFQCIEHTPYRPTHLGLKRIVKVSVQVCPRCEDTSQIVHPTTVPGQPALMGASSDAHGGGAEAAGSAEATVAAAAELS
jgi:hypothetical protein